MPETVAIFVLCVVIGGVAAQWLAWRLRLPAIVLLFAAGLIVGPGLEILQPSRAIGHAFHAVIGLAVAIVVFEGGLALDFRELRAAGEGVSRLTILALPICWTLGALAAHSLGGMSWGVALLYGAITVVTGPTVVLPLLRHTRLQRRAAAFLKWEAIVNDPIGAILATIVLDILLARSEGGLLIRVIGGVAVSLALGVGAAFLVRLAFSRDQVPEVLKTPLLLAFALGVYALSNLFLDGAGLLAATVFGVALSNLHVTGLSELRRFKEALVVLIVSGLFIVLTADLDRALLQQLSWSLLALTAAMLFVVRPMAIVLATARSSLTMPERALSAWIAPRGIVAAAVAGLAGIRLHEAGYPGAQLIMPAVFSLIAATMILHGFTLGPLSRRLKLTLGDKPGIAIVGASGWATEMARLLTETGVTVTLIDTFPGALDDARKMMIPVIQAEILSDHGEEELAGRPIDYLLAATPDGIYNGLVCARIAPEIGRQRVFQLASTGDHHDMSRAMSRDWRGRIFGAREINFDALEYRYAKGWRFSVAQANEDGDLSLPDDAIALLIIRTNDTLAVVTVEDVSPAIAAPNDRVLAFIPPEVS